METIGTLLQKTVFYNRLQDLDQNRAEGIRKAKAMLIEDIAKINGRPHSPVEFNDLYDLDTDQLHCEVVKAQDQRYFSKNK